MSMSEAGLMRGGKKANPTEGEEEKPKLVCCNLLAHGGSERSYNVSSENAS